MMGHRERMITSDEYDYLTRYRRYLHSNRGRAHRCKHSFSRRVRRLSKAEIRKGWW
jgi:hypothetical protein